MKFDIFAKKIFLEDRIIKDSYITIEDDLITAISNSSNSSEVIDLKDINLTPGFIDIHVHGGNGYDIMDGTLEAVEEISMYKIKEGVTAFCPTTVTANEKATLKAIEVVKESINKVKGAKIIGTFLEGPFISHRYKGAHPEEFIKKIDLDEIKSLIKHGEGTIKSIALAPELENFKEAVDYLLGEGVNVRIGHSGADYAQVNEAIEQGCNIAIHTFNAMSGFTHREPNFVGAVLVNDDIYGEIIVDKVHVHQGAVKVFLKCKGIDRTILVTDCMSAGGKPDGKYKLGELPVIVKDSIVRTSSGALAGSTLKIDLAVRNLLNLKVSLYDAVKTVTQMPAKALNIYNEIGSITIGKKADFTGLDECGNIKFVMVNGRQVL